jgi:hypothetical protein
VQYGWPIGMPLCKSLCRDLWEVRRTLEGGRIERVIFFFHDGEIGVLQGYIKKTWKTPTG